RLARRELLRGDPFALPGVLELGRWMIEVRVAGVEHVAPVVERLADRLLERVDAQLERLAQARRRSHRRWSLEAAGRHVRLVVRTRLRSLRLALGDLALRPGQPLLHPALEHSRTLTGQPSPRERGPCFRSPPPPLPRRKAYASPPHPQAR